jgi:hypothetical protein
MNLRLPYKVATLRLLLAVIGVLGLSSHAIAAEKSKQKSAPWINEFLAAQEKQDCQAMWDLLWPKAKKGDIEARFALFMATWAPPHMTAIKRPGLSQDTFSYMRDLAVFTVYSTGVKDETSQSVTDNYYKVFDRIYKQLNFKEIGGGEFIKCVKDTRSNECTKIAVKNNLVPSFEDYAKEVDLLVKGGGKPKCSFHPDK